MNDTPPVLNSVRKAQFRDEEAQLWRDYRGSDNVSSREKIFRHYVPLARRLASKYIGLQSRSSIEYDDLFQLACTGLLESIDRYNPDLGVPFRYFANRRINGAMLNGIAKHSEIAQQISTRRRIAQERISSLRSGEGKPASLDDALTALGDIAAGLALGLILEEARGDQPELVDTAPSAFETVAWQQMVKLVRDGIDQLPLRERDILIWHYIEGLRFDQIGDVLHLTKGRVSQVHKAAIALLRKRLLNSSHFRLEG